jgi:alkaline phosphatase
MIKLIKLSAALAVLLSVTIAATAQIKEYTVANAHAHNDYHNDIPFYRAYEKGFGSIEADVFAVDGQLMVAHDKKDITPDRSLKILYINPLVEKFKHDKTRELRLLIEIKGDYKEILPLVIKELDPLKEYFSYAGHPGRLSIVMTGAVPPGSQMVIYPQWLSFDVDHLDGFTPSEWKRIGMVSIPFSKYVRWNGKGVLTHADISKVKGAIDSVHNAGKIIRFYETPDTKSSWLALIRLGVDVIGTDHVEELGDFLNNKVKNEYLSPQAYEVYHPTYHSDGSPKKVKNIILCIGDGMGLAQLYAAYTANRGKLNIFQMQNIGFSITNSADAYVTDSEAGGTAIAAGQKTDNRAVGVDPSGKPLKSLAVYSAEAGKKTAVVACELTDVIPAAFYAHQQEWANTSAIAFDMASTPIDILLGSGYNDFTQKINGEIPLDKMQKRGYTVIRSFDDFLKSPAQKIVALVDDSITRPKMQGRSDYLPLAFNKVVNSFKDDKKGFFIMIEGSQVDHGVHNNNLTQVINENSGFDQAVGNALRFADEDGETLVIVTADHETGGLSLLDGNIAKGYVWGDFGTADHTGIPVPVFAYGPHAGDFRGVYNNVEIFGKLLSLINTK